MQDMELSMRHQTTMLQIQQDVVCLVVVIISLEKAELLHNIRDMPCLLPVVRLLKSRKHGIPSLVISGVTHNLLLLWCRIPSGEQQK
jgi:hypothetical protein